LFSIRNFLPRGRTDTTCVVPGESAFGSAAATTVEQSQQRLQSATQSVGTVTDQTEPSPPND
jgi:hypothetical protein